MLDDYRLKKEAEVETEKRVKLATELTLQESKKVITEKGIAPREEKKFLQRSDGGMVEISGRNRRYD